MVGSKKKLVKQKLKESNAVSAQECIIASESASFMALDSHKPLHLNRKAS